MSLVRCVPILVVVLSFAGRIVNGLTSGRRFVSGVNVFVHIVNVLVYIFNAFISGINVHAGKGQDVSCDRIAHRWLCRPHVEMPGFAPFESILRSFRHLHALLLPDPSFPSRISQRLRIIVLDSRLSMVSQIENKVRQCSQKPLQNLAIHSSDARPGQLPRLLQRAQLRPAQAIGSPRPGFLRLRLCCPYVRHAGRYANLPRSTPRFPSPVVVVFWGSSRCGSAPVFHSANCGASRSLCRRSQTCPGRRATRSGSMSS
jgi:hypothetical protein